ncbi:hypothetical protein V6N13_089616 [Hibiscus sabdariffa]|uniref:Uncharacterized protein n=1 Tax=Hibiscus sabdariffa TaxID=183260 RepID=A0ABR2QJB8_9ROSI
MPGASSVDPDAEDKKVPSFGSSDTKSPRSAGEHFHYPSYLYHPRQFSLGRLASEESDGVTLLFSSSGLFSGATRHVDRGIFWFHILKLLFIRCLLIQEEEERDGSSRES